MTSATAILSVRRIFFLGVNTGFVTNGLPDARYVDFYRRRSSPALYCSIIGNVVVPGGYGSNSATPTLSSSPVWSEIADVIGANGTLPGIQLATTWEGYAGTRKFVGADAELIIPQARELIAAMGAASISAVLDAFEKGALLSVEHGYRHVQVHAAHGYLLSLIIDERINPDAATVYNRLSALSRQLATSGIETSVRISIRTGDPAFDAEGADRYVDTVATLPFDYFDLSSGFYNIDKRLIYPTRPEIVSARHLESLSVAARHPTRSFIMSGRAMDRASDDLLPNVHIGICRDLIANPNFLAEPHEGCRNHNKCHYFSRGEKHLTCPRWADV